ncbi:MAG: FAD-dependent oxidoreductase [Actinomycetota bacterium]
MNRRNFLVMASVLGIGTAVGACGDDGDSGATSGDGADPESTGRVIIVGAGAAGLSAGHLLAQRGVDFQIVEAAPTHGGRVKRTSDFVDFPIPLGGEWLHAEESTLTDIVNDDSVEVTQQMQPYSPDDEIAAAVGGELAYDTLGEYTDLKFVGATWLDFFDEYVVPGIADRMVFDTPIVAIDHGGDEVRMTDANGEEWTADHIILTVPMKTLQDGDIEFTPGLPDEHTEALDRANIWTGMKVFLEFSEAFYPVFLALAGDGDADGQRAYYDAAYGQDSEANVLGLFTVGELSEPYQALDPGDELRDFILAELDPLFDGAASRTYIQHVSQNWADEPYVGAAYLADTADEDISQVLGQNIGPRVFMAGCSYTREYDWSSVHTAARSARAAVDELLA